ncbi:hypothetical protein EsH8_VII_000270 [Colletotrichum jinshuiense]
MPEEECGAMKSGAKDAFMGARLSNSKCDDVLGDELEGQKRAQTGPTPYWIKEANKILGIRGNDEEDELYEYHDGVNV